MGKEIEMKIPLDDNEYERLMTMAKGIDKGPEHIIKSDVYFSRYDTEAERKEACLALKEPKVVRIRSQQTEENGVMGKVQSYFCMKFKEIKDGLEYNREDETFVEDEKVIRDFLEIAGYKKYFEKNKESYSVYCRSDVDKDVLFHVELVTVNGHKYIETEVTDSPLDSQRVGAALDKFIAQLGLDISKKDSRSWMEITAQDS